MTIRHLILPLLSILSLSPFIQASFLPFLGCKDENAYGVPEGTDCSAVDSYLCEFRYPSGCQQITGTYYYYNGGVRRDGGQTYPEDFYEAVTVAASSGCGAPTERSCSVSWEGETCQGCTNTGADWKKITLTDCSNVVGAPFAATPSTFTLEEGGGHCPLKYTDEQCQHPAVTGRRRLTITGRIEYSMGPVSPTQAENRVMVTKTNAWFKELLGETASDQIPLFQVFQMGSWNTFFRGRPVGGTLGLDYNATVILDPSDTTTVADLEAIMMDPIHMGWYVNNTVKPTRVGAKRPFLSVVSATGTVDPLPVKR